MSKGALDGLDAIVAAPQDTAEARPICGAKS